MGVGGGLIRPMQQRWEGWLSKAGAESAAIREHAKAYADERRAVDEAERAEAEKAEETQVIPPPRQSRPRRVSP